MESSAILFKKEHFVVEKNSKFCLSPLQENYETFAAEYRELYNVSVSQPQRFWNEIGKSFHIQEEQPQGHAFSDCNINIKEGPVSIKWMERSKTNISFNCIDRHVESGLGDTVAIYWEGNDPKDCSSMTYKQLLDNVCKLAFSLKSLGIRKGDRVMLYMPMIPEHFVAMLACARIGAVHCVVFAGFSAKALALRIQECGIKLVVTADGFMRGTKLIPLKSIVDDALCLCKQKPKCVVVQHLTKFSDSRQIQTPFFPARDVWWHDLIAKAPTTCDVEWVDSEDPLFILSTSGSTGSPKHVVHTVWGYMVYTALSFKYTMHLKPKDVFWTTADLGWMAGHTYGVYGPLLNGISTVLYEGTPTHPTVSRFWKIIKKYRVTQFFTAPTAIRSLMVHGEELVKKHDLSSLRVLASSGEPLNPKEWEWYYKVVGSSKVVMADFYGQTETGSILLFPLPSAQFCRPTLVPFFGIVPVILDETGVVVEGVGKGFLVIRDPWPGMARTLFQDHDRFQKTYFTPFPGYFFTGDWAYRGVDGGIQVLGRVDDMLNVSGHLLSTAEVEGALAGNPAVAESAAVPIKHQIKGQALYCFVTLKQKFGDKEGIVVKLKETVREKIGSFAVPDTIRICSALPKTRSGKIMRKVLKNIAEGGKGFEDMSSMEDPSVIMDILDSK